MPCGTALAGPAAVVYSREAPACRWIDTQTVTDYSIYLHIPFCRHKCSYCDFNTYAGLENLIGGYIQALSREIELAAQAAGERLPVHTIFFGGGTPSLLPSEDLAQVFDRLHRAFEIHPEAEITLEANPGTLSPDYLRALRSVGVNRLSLGVQSAHPEDLRLLEREHGYFEVTRSFAWARRAGIENINLDLIFGLPDQSLSRWQQTLELALELNPEHFSLYALTLEHGTPLEAWVQRGLAPEPDSDRTAEMYDWATERLAAAGYVQYEISNWARRETGKSFLACRHNLQYWRNQPYLGLGAGAHGFAGGYRTANVLAPAAYIRRLATGGAADFPATPATVSLEVVDRETEMQETMLMGLRLTLEGVSRARFQGRFGAAPEDVFQAEIQMLCQQGLLEWTDDDERALRLSKT